MAKPPQAGFREESREVFISYRALIDLRVGGTMVLVEPSELPISRELCRELETHRALFPPT